MIKNLPATAKEGELKELFERYGSLKRFLVSPFNTLAIAEYEDASQAQAALKNLAYHKVNFITPIYLELAPTGFVKPTSVSWPFEQQPGDEVAQKQQRQIFVKNLNFKTTEI